MKVFDHVGTDCLELEMHRHYFGNAYRADTKRIIYQPGEYIIEQEEPSFYLHLIYRGRCNVRIFLPNGKTVILQTLKAPSLVGEMELLRNVSSYCVQALEECTMLSLSLAACGERLLNDAHFLRAVCHDLVGKERVESLDLIRSFAYPLENRLARFILDNRQGDLFAIRQVDAADSLGVTARHVGNVIRGFAAAGYLEKRKTAFFIRNEEALQALAAEI